MKKIVLFFILGISFNRAFAQNDISNAKAGWGNLDYAVPESPAFKLLGNNPDNILQPTSVKSMAVSIGNYYLNTGSTIPKNLAVEISPLLLNSKVSLNDYNKNKFLYRTRLSLGTTVSNNGAYNIAEGLRFTIIDKTDMRSNPEALDYFYTQATNNSIAIDKILSTHPNNCGNTVECRERFRTDSSFKKKILNTYADALLSADSVADFRDKMRQKLWNAAIMEVGLGAVQTYPDSLLSKNLTEYKLGLWITFGTHLSKNDQILFGGKLGYTDSLSNSNVAASIAARYYYGSNELRAYVQGEYRYENNLSGTVASIGCVFKITNGLWGNGVLNFVFDDNGKITYNPGFNVSFGTPEKKKL